MQFKQYLSSIFYLTEASKYLEGNLKLQNEELVKQLFNQGFEELNYIGFKIFLELKQRFPDLIFFSAKAFAKQSAQFYLTKEYNRQNCPFIREGQFDENFSIEENIFDGELYIVVNDYGCFGHTNQEDDYATRRIMIHFNKFKRFNQQDLEKLTTILNRLYNH